ncbi:MAG: hypothetical protein F6K55_44640 [Moorea sp. SIO4A3]|nr:hypothetical protein [Moorena sp. SIO4A3]
MANIKVNDIKPAGADLFADDEGFLNELEVDELGNIVGGRFTVLCYNAEEGFSLVCVGDK